MQRSIGSRIKVVIFGCTIGVQFAEGLVTFRVEGAAFKARNMALDIGLMGLDNLFLHRTLHPTS